MNHLTQLYKRILESMDCVINEEDDIFIRVGGELVPVVIKIEGVEKRLVLPTVKKRKQWKDTEWVAFHPACESVFKGQSEVITALTIIAGLKLFESTQHAVVSMISLAADKKKQETVSRLPLRQLLSNFPEVSAGTIMYLSEVIKKSTGIFGERPLLGLRMKVSPTIGEFKYKRSCKLIVPVLDEKDPIYGIKNASAASMEAVKTAYSLAMPTQREFGSNSDSIPYLAALLGMFYTAATHLNELKNTLGNNAVSEFRTIDLTWYEEVPKIRDLMHVHLNMVLPGNKGINEENRVATVAGVAVPKIPKIGTSAVATRPESNFGINRDPVPEPTRSNFGTTAAAIPTRQQSTGVPTLEDRLRMNRSMSVVHTGFNNPMPTYPVNNFGNNQPVGNFGIPNGGGNFNGVAGNFGAGNFGIPNAPVTRSSRYYR